MDHSDRQQEPMLGVPPEMVAGVESANGDVAKVLSAVRGGFTTLCGLERAQFSIDQAIERLSAASTLIRDTRNREMRRQRLADEARAASAPDADVLRGARAS